MVRGEGVRSGGSSVASTARYTYRCNGIRPCLPSAQPTPAPSAPAPPPKPDADGAMHAVGLLRGGDVEQSSQRPHRQARVGGGAQHCVRLAAAGLAIRENRHVKAVGAGADEWPYFVKHFLLAGSAAEDGVKLKLLLPALAGVDAERAGQGVADGAAGVPAACALPRNNTSRHGPFWAYYEDDYNRTLRGICSRRTSRRFGYSTDVPSAELMVLPPQASEFETPILNKPVDVDLLERVLDRWRPAA